MKTIRLYSILTQLLVAFVLLTGFSTSAYAKTTASSTPIKAVTRLNPTTAEILFENGQRMTVDFYGNYIFRLFLDPNGGFIREPEASPEAHILVQNPRRTVEDMAILEESDRFVVKTKGIELSFDKKSGLFKAKHAMANHGFEQTSPVQFGKDGDYTLTLKANPTEYFYGGGVQNGRFSHKGKIINIVNENSWTDGGVSSPTPFYWTTNGYGFMAYTFKKGKYDFGATDPNTVILTHESDYLDVFFMIDDTTECALLNDYYQLTGNPVLLPKFAFYEGHLNAYNRDYWKEDENGILFEDGKKYKESQKENGGIKESLNGEKDNYQFSARAVIDRYKQHDMPLGWILPNDGYGSGYGQAETLDGNIQNLKELGDYARKNGVEIGLWTQSDLHPKAGVSALLQRDIVKEIRDAGVRALKTDVAWVGDGYSFGLNGIADVGEIMPYYGNNARPFIITVDGWAGTQRYAGVWTGDQTGGEWEYIRFHIPTYIGAGLSGQPNITSDTDGIFGGKNVPVNVRDFQWKAFTPMQLNMDGWGSNEKYPHALGEPATSINRMYLKIKSEFLPYTYTYAHEALTGKPLMRALFLDYPNEYTYGSATKYEYLYGPDFLVAPVYQNTQADEQGNDIRDGIYLPEGEWIDSFSGDLYQGGCIINNFDAPLWKLPLFVRRGAILPMNRVNNHVSEVVESERIVEVYPGPYNKMNVYDDDGVTEEYRHNIAATYTVESEVKGDDAVITIHPTQSTYPAYERNKTTEFVINVSEKPKNVLLYLNGKKVKLTEVTTGKGYYQNDNVFMFDPKPDFNRYSTPGSEFAKVPITMNPQIYVKIQKTDVIDTDLRLIVKGYKFERPNKLLQQTGALSVPAGAVTEKNTDAYSLTPSWDKISNADYYEIEFQNMLYTTIKNNFLKFEDLLPETTYQFKLRAVNKDGHSDWNTFTAKTKVNPLEFAIQGIKGEISAKEMEGMEIGHLFDFNEGGDLWHTDYSTKAVPFDLIMDLNSYNTIDKFQYLPRKNAGAGTILKGNIAYSMDKKNWTEAGTFEWNRDNVTKEFFFPNQPEARYIKMHITEAVRDFGSGRELYVFKKAGTESAIPGDINHDNKIDRNDLMSYMNYTGVRKGDKDYEGYISRGDINRNGLIDAYDISSVGIYLEDGVSHAKIEPVQGKLEMSADKKRYAKDETIEIVVKGIGMKSVNAFSLAIPYDAQKVEYLGTETKGTKEMENLTNDRLHSNGTKALYPTFVNLGYKPAIEGDEELLVIRFKAKQALNFDMKMQDCILVDKDLRAVENNE